MNYTKISLVAKTDEKLHYFIGSTLRGAFGYALKRVVCVNPSHRCYDCFAKANCLFYEFYEEKNSFHKYRFDFELAPKNYEFSIYLFDDTISETPYVISALHEMFSKIGLGKDRKTFEEFQIYVNDTLVYNGDEYNMPESYEKEFSIDEYKKDVKILLKTPLRMKKDNKYLINSNFEIKDIIKSIFQREANLKGLGFQRVDFEINYDSEKKYIFRKNIQRYSNRQQQKMELYGIMGEIEVENIDENSYRLLKLGELIGVGKQCVFGLGKIEVV